MTGRATTDRSDAVPLTLTMGTEARFGERVRCPVCANPIDAELGTPAVPSDVLCDRGVSERVGDPVPVYGWRCPRHRSHTVRVLAPAALAPAPYEAVAAVVAGRRVEIAIPRPVVEDGESR